MIDRSWPKDLTELGPYAMSSSQIYSLFCFSYCFVILIATYDKPTFFRCLIFLQLATNPS